MVAALALALTHDVDELGDGYRLPDAGSRGASTARSMAVTLWVVPSDPALFLTSRRVLGWAYAMQGEDARAAELFLEAARFWAPHDLVYDMYENRDWWTGLRFTWRAYGQAAAEEVAAEGARAIEESAAALDAAREAGDMQDEWVELPEDFEWLPDIHDWASGSRSATVYIELARLAFEDGLLDDVARYLELAIAARPFGWPEPDREAFRRELEELPPRWARGGPQSNHLTRSDGSARR